MVEVPPTGNYLQAIATAVIEAFADRRLELYPDPDLLRDCKRFRVEERSYGFRLTSPRDATGHGDLGTAFCLAMLAATELAAKKVQVASAGFHDTGHTPLQRELARLDAERQSFAREQESFLRGEDHQAPWKEIMRQCGRSDESPFFLD